MQPKPHQWQIVTYEELVANPTETLIEIAKKWKTQISIEKALAQLQKPSSTVHETGVSKLNSWQLQLSKTQINNILNITSQFGLDFYQAQTMPVYHPSKAII